MNNALDDLRFGLRLLRKNPGFTAVAVLTLSLGIGANTAIFSVVNSIVLAPLPYPESDRLVTICETNPAVAQFCIVSPPNVEDWSELSRTLTHFGLGRGWGFILKTSDGVVGARGGIATPGLFGALQIQPEIGRLFLEDDLDPANNQVVVLSYGYWQTQFAGDSTIVGRAITLDNKSYTVVGVLPAGAEVPRLEGMDLWTPLPFHPRDEENRGWRGFRAYARLAQGVALEDAWREMETIAAALTVRYPETNEGWGIEIVGLHEIIVGNIRSTLLMFLGAVGFVLLIGCANVANLLLARSTRRRREFAIRAALGAGRGRMIRLLLTETTLLALLGGAAGLLLAFWGVEAFVNLAPGNIPRIDEVSVDATALGFALGASILTTVLAGLIPSLQTTRVNLTQALKAGEEGKLGISRFGVRDLLVVSQVALALVLLIGAGLLTQSFATLLRWDPGFDRDNLTTVWLASSSGKYTDGFQVAAVQRRAVEIVQALPSVVSVGTTSAGPLFGGTETDEYTVVGEPAPPVGERPVARWFDVGPNYFRTLGVPIVRGRPFTEADGRGAPPVAIVNEALVRQQWPDRDPLGQQVTVYGKSMSIVGVVADVAPFEVGSPVGPEIYWPQLQSPRWATYLVIRTSSDPAGITRPARARLQELDPDMRISAFTSMDQLISRRVVRPRFNMLLLGIFAVVAVALSAVGIYGVVTYTVASRTQEMGIRIALGAGKWNIVQSVLRQGMLPVVIGLGLGLVAAFGLTRVLSSLLYGVAPTDPVTFGAVAASLVTVSALACYVPARRATKVNPMTAVRAE